ncbi:MAG: NADH-quinone oxidoreductase subunit A [Pirellulales bacterium]
MDTVVLPVVLFILAAAGLGAGMIGIGTLVGPKRNTRVKEMPYESGMDPIHDTRRRFDFRFHLVAIAFLVFDVELLFLYPWAVASRPAVPPGGGSLAAAELGVNGAVAAGLISSRGLVFAGVAFFLVLLVLGLVYDWKKGVFQWR